MNPHTNNKKQSNNKRTRTIEDNKNILDHNDDNNKKMKGKHVVEINLVSSDEDDENDNTHCVTVESKDTNDIFKSQLEERKRKKEKLKREKKKVELLL